jgi:two-component system cell cycle response regulator CtrA
MPIDLQAVAPSQFPMTLATNGRVPETRITRVLVIANDMCDAGGISALAAADCVIVRMDSVERALELMSPNNFDVIMVDFRPDFVGHQAVCKLRMVGIELPVLFISACSSAAALKRAYDVGADDAVPFSTGTAAVKARLISLAQDMNSLAAAAQTLHFGPVAMDLADRAIRIGGESISLSADEYDALEALAARNGGAVSRNAIVASARSALPLASHGSAETIIVRLRRKLEKAGAGNLIDSIRGVGYALRTGCTIDRDRAFDLAQAA